MSLLPCNIAADVERRQGGKAGSFRIRHSDRRADRTLVEVDPVLPVSIGFISLNF